MERPKGSIRVFSSVDHVTASSTSSCPSLRSFASLAPSREEVRSSLPHCVFFLFFVPSLFLPFLRLIALLFRRHDRVSVPAMLRVQEFRIGKKGQQHGLPPDPNSSTSPRYFRSPVSALLLPTKSLPRFFQLQVGTPLAAGRTKLIGGCTRLHG